MKRFLIQKLHIPENAVIMEPHARHTTTNMRNGVRLMFRYGMPMDKPGLTSTERGQSTWISGTLVERCKRSWMKCPINPDKDCLKPRRNFTRCWMPCISTLRNRWTRNTNRQSSIGSRLLRGFPRSGTSYGWIVDFSLRRNHKKGRHKSESILNYL